MATTAKGYRYPIGTDPNNTPADIRRLAEDVDASPGIRAYTQAEIDALPAAQKWTGRKIWNVTAGVHQSWNGAQWVTDGVDLSNGKHLTVGDAGGALLDHANDIVLGGYNWRFDGVNYVRLLADNDASRIVMDVAGDFVFYTASDAGATVGSAITWTERVRITKAGLLTFGGDASIYRSAANEIATGAGDNLYVAGGVLSLGAAPGPNILEGTGSPEGVVTARVGSTYHRRDGSAGTSLYVKQSGSGNTGWVGK